MPFPEVCAYCGGPAHPGEACSPHAEPGRPIVVTDTPQVDLPTPGDLPNIFIGADDGPQEIARVVEAIDRLTAAVIQVATNIRESR